MDYQQQANEFAKKHGIKLAILGNVFKRYFDDDKERRMVYTCRLSRNRKTYTFQFGASIANPEEPDMYTILACLQKSDIGDFEDFCIEFGYDTDSRKAERIYKSVCKEWAAMERLFTPEILEEMQEIQ